MGEHAVGGFCHLFGRPHHKSDLFAHDVFNQVSHPVRRTFLLIICVPCQAFNQQRVDYWSGGCFRHPSFEAFVGSFVLGSFGQQDRWDSAMVLIIATLPRAMIQEQVRIFAEADFVATGFNLLVRFARVVQNIKVNGEVAYKHLMVFPVDSDKWSGASRPGTTRCCSPRALECLYKTICFQVRSGVVCYN